MKTVFFRVLDSVRDAVFPPRCMACGILFLKDAGEMPFHRQDLKPERKPGVVFRRVMAPLLCGGCIGRFREIVSPVCPRCGRMYDERESDDHLCGDCLVRPGKISFARAVGVYDEALMGMIRTFKYGKRTRSAKAFGRLLFHLYSRCYLNGPMKDRRPDIIVPVPLHVRRFRDRGFNQAWMLVREWPELFRGRHTGTFPELVREALVRHRWTEPQAGLDRRQRKTNIKGAFSVSGKVDIRGKRVLLVDDVYTTGATAEECAAVLLKNGASDVHILTLARTSQ